MCDGQSNADECDEDSDGTSGDEHDGQGPKCDENEVFWSEEENIWKSKNLNGNFLISIFFSTFLHNS